MKLVLLEKGENVVRQMMQGRSDSVADLPPVRLVALRDRFDDLPDARKSEQRLAALEFDREVGTGRIEQPLDGSIRRRLGHVEAIGLL